MITQQLINPKSIAVIGASNNLHKPGGKLLNNIINGKFKGKIYAVNPKEETVQGIKCNKSIQDLPDIDCAILAIPAKFCIDTVDVLANNKNTKAFVIISAGFSEESDEGHIIEKKITDIVNRVKGSLIGPNCIGFINNYHHSVFTSPVPDIVPDSCDLISGSGATAVFLIESGIPKGLKFSSIWSVGNSAQIGVEEVLEYMDESFNPETDSKIKLLYIETIKNPDKLLKHASSLIRKGCKIAAIKAGNSESGSRAAASHTGALTGSDKAVEALYRKAGIVRCHGREELAIVAAVFTQKEIKGKNIAIITHAGGPGVMLTDTLEAGGLNIPKIEGKHEENLLKMMYGGASASNPIDMIATGTAEQLEKIIDYCEEHLDFIDVMMVIFGSPGLFNVFDVYNVLHNKIKSCKKPIYPILPSILTAKAEVDDFLSKGNINLSDEVLLGEAIVRIHHTPKPADEKIIKKGVNIDKIRSIIENTKNGFQSPGIVMDLLKAASIPVVSEKIVKNKKQLLAAALDIGYPLVMKVIGPIHKTEVGGVILNVKTKLHLQSEFRRLMKIKGAKGVEIQPMLSGTEIFIGAKYEPKFGHIMLFGLGGIYVEVLNDVSSGLAPLTKEEAISMVRSIKSYKIIKGFRGKHGVNENMLIDILVRLSTMLRYATEIKELDINPLIGKENNLHVVDARILIEK